MSGDGERVAENGSTYSSMSEQREIQAAGAAGALAAPTAQERMGTDRLSDDQRGGPKILDRVQKRLGISEEDLIFSRSVLRDCGNMSSSTVLFVLDRIRRSGPDPGDVGLLVSFGPGLTLDGILLRW